MAWIEQVPIEKASGLLKRLYDDAIKRTGRVFRIRQIMSLNPPVLRESMRFYYSVMMGESPLGRFQRELIGTVVARALGCEY